ncbi:aldehyde dehydrogenase family protein [Hoyosella subflava]|uniref:Aldehyde dehydrogenase n=1 Tax=Hoyosella subflava (strain DSM 45089 / JCM 17490 / NBRC 109087 / DQS3-9A1) TaxID=443218 RepID=F6EL78_HOYSD|nr:aldehyde dehydrogenase family protein [Hoyosella subflava]AEF39170.1 Putative aldehyde dehydrogenase [Hoyosella subflava DQS3-9A1]
MSTTETNSGTAPAQSASALASKNPATGDVISVHAIQSPEEVRAAVERARSAARSWNALGFDGRKQHLLRWVSYLLDHADELSELIHAENGKPVDDAYLELVLAVEHIAWAAKHAKKVLSPKKVAPGLLMANFSAVIEQHPLGVIGVIGPWNYPVYTPMGSIAYALAAGNSVVFKPSEYTTAVGNYLADSFRLANPELREHILTTVNGYGETGAALVTSGVNKIAFTGSTPTGKRIMAAAAESLTPVLLECGGKDAAIVAADADVKAAADAIAFGAMANSGQTCVGVERVYVDKRVSDEFITEIKKIIRDLKPGDAEGASYGPMTMPSQIDIVRSHIEDALEHGGRAVVGGADSVKERYIEPVVIVDADETCSAVVEETFGPTLTIRTVDSADEAIELANASRFGLASTVFSKNHGMEIARRLRAGATSVNSVLGFAAIPALPFGGVGESGIGRIHGEWGLKEFTRPHAIANQRFAIPGMALLSFKRTKMTTSLVKQTMKLLHGRYK